MYTNAHQRTNPGTHDISEAKDLANKITPEAKEIKRVTHMVHRYAQMSALLRTVTQNRVETEPIERNMMNQGKPCILRWRQRRGCKKTFWVKNHWGKIGVDGMLTFVPPFSGFMPFWGMSGGLWHERFHMNIVYTCAKAKPKPGNCSSCVLHITELRFFGQIFGEIHNRNRVHRWTQPFLDVKRYRNCTAL